MLDLFRKQASSWGMKAILGLIIFSFVFFGLSGIFQSGSKSHAVATVGGVDISKQAFYKELQKALDSIQKETGKKISLQDLYQAGIVHQLLERNIEALLLAQEVERLKLTTPDDVVLDVVRKNPMFAEDGKFSRQKFDRVLAANRITEQYFVKDMRERLTKVQLLAAISSGGYAPSTLLNSFFSTAYEKRTISIIVPKIAVDPAKINDAEIAKFYESAKDKFRTPEYRSFKVLILDPAELVKHVKVTDADLKAAYEQQKESFYDEDRRDVLMIRVRDRQEAASVKTLIKQGKVSTLVDSIPLKNATRGDMPEDALADIAFKLPAGGVSEMVHVEAMNQDFVLYVEKIIPGGLKPFSKVKGQVLEDLRQQKSMDEMATLTRTIEDKISANVNFAQLAKEHHLKLVSVQGVNASGLLKNGKKASEGLSPDILKTAFETQANMESPIVEIEDAPFFVVHVDAVEPSTVPPLTHVRDQVKQMLVRKVTLETSEAKTHEIVGALGKGKTLTEISKTIPSVVHTFTVDPSDPKASTKLDKHSLVRLFSLAQGSHITIPFENQLALGQVVKIMPASTKDQGGRFDKVAELLTASNNQEIIHQYMKALREKHGVKIYAESIESLITLGEAAAAAAPAPIDMDGM